MIDDGWRSQHGKSIREMSKGLERRTAHQQRRTGVLVKESSGEAIDTMRTISYSVSVLIPPQVVAPVITTPFDTPFLVFGAHIENLLTIASDYISNDVVAT